MEEIVESFFEKFEEGKVRGIFSASKHLIVLKKKTK
jgi:hypothetical protein